MKVSRYNMMTGKVCHMELDVTPQDLARHQRGELVQDVFPHLTADEREFLVSGLMPGDWEKLMGDEDEVD